MHLGVFGSAVSPCVIEQSHLKRCRSLMKTAYSQTFQDVVVIFWKEAGTHVWAIHCLSDALNKRLNINLNKEQPLIKHNSNIQPLQ